MSNVSFGQRSSVAVSGIAIVVVFTVVTAEGRRIRVAQTIRSYNQQKLLIHTVVAEFVEELQSDGSVVVNDSSGTSGSGDWRDHVALKRIRPNGKTGVAYVEVMGFVSHDSAGAPDWQRNLPLRISHDDSPLNGLFISMLTQQLQDFGWAYSVDHNIHGFARFGHRQSPQ